MSFYPEFGLLWPPVRHATSREGVWTSESDRYLRGIRTQQPKSKSRTGNEASEVPCGSHSFPLHESSVVYNVTTYIDQLMIMMACCVHPCMAYHIMAIVLARLTLPWQVDVGGRAGEHKRAGRKRGARK